MPAALRETRSTGQVADRLRMSSPSVSKHLTILRRAGFVAAERRQNLTVHSLTLLGEAILGRRSEPYMPMPSPSPYLTRHTRPERPARRLVCFPHAGGAASFYRPWARYTDPSVELLAVQYPGRENRFREPLIPTMDPLASAVAAELLALPPLPTVFFGHSLGAAVAYETLLRLEQTGAAHVTRLCVSGRSPDGPSGPAVRTDDEVVEAVRSLGGTHAAVFDDPDMRELLLPAIRNDYHLIRDYRRRADAPPLRADVHALTGDRDPQVTPEEAAGWGAATSGSFTLTVLEGDHFYLVPTAERVARIAMEPAQSLPV